jgi:hypothetical protein
MTDEERQYVFEAFESWARSGYARHLLDELEDRVGDLVPDAPRALVEEVRVHARRVLDEQRAAEQGWTEPTVNDRITEAFAALEDRGIVALEDAGYTMSEGWSDVNEAADDFPDPRGGTFFHGQDVERGVRGEGLMLAFGSFEDGEGHEAASVAVGREIVEVLEAHGVPTEWSGSVKERIRVLPFPWRRRQFTESPL